MAKLSRRQRISLIAGGTALAVALYLSYCSAYSRIWPLTSEEKKYVVQQIEYGKAELPFVEELAKAADADALFDSHKEKNLASFLRDVEKTSETLDTFFSEGRIYKYRGGKKGSPAFYRKPPFFLGYYVAVRDCIVVNEEHLSDGNKVSVPEFNHEAAHALFFAHDPSLSHGTVNEFSPETAEKIIQAKDFPYLVTFLFYVADRTLQDPYDSIARKQESFQGDIKKGKITPQKAYDQLKKVPAEEKEHWLNAVVKNEFYTAITFRDVFGWSEEGFRNALRSSGLFEYRQGVFQSGVCAFAAEYPEINAPECPLPQL